MPGIAFLIDLAESSFNNLSIQNLRGFTLLELLVVVLVLGILASVLVLSISGSNEDSSVAVVQNSLKTIQEQIDIFTMKEGAYPPSIDRAWFQGYVLPRHPLIDSTTPKVHN
jgi:prepilin-type N-terminal cleavage/methylation domain-containing protein